MPLAAIEFVGLDWPRMPELLGMLFGVLYRDFGVAEDADWYHAEDGDVTLVALAEDGGLLGSARLLGRPGDARRQVRQVAVEPGVQSAGVGRALMAALEARAQEEGATEAWLNARDTAIPFYERLGYTAEGDVFVSELTGIPHRLMRKPLG